MTLRIEPKNPVVGGDGRRRDGRPPCRRAIGREADHDLHPAAVVACRALVGGNGVAVVVLGAAGTGNRNVHLLRRRQPDRAAEPRGAGPSLSRHSAAKRSDPGAGQGPATPQGSGKPTGQRGRRRRPAGHPWWGDHRQADGAAAEIVRRHHTVDTGASRIPAAARPISRLRAAGSAPEHELVESRARVAPRRRAGGAAATDDRSRAESDAPRIQRAGVSGYQPERAGTASDRTRSAALTSGSAGRPRAGARAHSFVEASAFSSAWRPSAAARLAKIGSLVMSCSRSRWACSFSPLSERIWAM